MKKIQLKNALKKYIEDEMIMEFDSLQDIMDFMNYNCPDIENEVDDWNDVKKELGEYVFFYNGKYYDILFDEALEVKKYLPKGYFEKPNLLKHTDSLGEFEAYIDGMLEGHNSPRSKAQIINEYSNLFGYGDWIIKTLSITSKIDFKCFSDVDNYFDEDRESFVGDLKDLLGLESIDIDDTSTWLPKLKQIKYIEDLGFAINDVEDAFYDILERLYCGVEEYNNRVSYANKVIELYKNKYDDIDDINLAFIVGQVYQLNNDGNNTYDQNKIYEMVKASWKEYDGFSYENEEE